MKKLLLLLFLLPVSLTAQNINVPDPVLKSILVNISPSSGMNNVAYNLDGAAMTIDANGDDEIQISEAMAVYRLVIFGSAAMENELLINDITGLEMFTNLRELALINHSIENVSVTNLNFLEDLNLENAGVLNLDVSGIPSLKYLRSTLNDFATVNFTGTTNLQTIQITQGNLTSINLQGQNSLTVLDLANNTLNELDLTGAANLIAVHCQWNNIQNINFNGLQNLSQIELHHNNVSSLILSDLPSLDWLGCSNNNLATLELFDVPNLTLMFCSYNDLVNLTIASPTALEGIYCSFNNLTNLDLSNCPNLVVLDISNNELSSLDVSVNPLLNGLSVADNYNLAYLNLKNGNTNYYNTTIFNNPSLQYVCVDDVDSALSLFGQYVPETCTINSYCSFTPGGEYYTVDGTTSYSDNGNCNNGTQLPLQSINVSNSDISGAFMSNSAGIFSVPVSEGTYTFSPVNPNPAYFQVSPPSVTVNFPTDTSPYPQNFCVSPLGSFNDLEVTLIPITPARPGFDSDYRILLSNVGTTTLSGSVNLDFMGEIMDYVSSSTVPDAINESSLVWNYTDLAPFEQRIIDFTMNINSPMENPPVEIDYELDFSLTATPVDGDAAPANNYFAIKQVVVGSYDPNDKTCVEGKSIPLDKVGDYVHYIIRFENTGNFYAENIVVEDMIDLAKFDINSLVPLTGSHSYITRVSDGNKVEFIFENIMLPGLPSDDRHGYLSFKIKTLPTLQAYDTFSNTASIFFDFNAPIVTNNAITMVSPSLGTENPSFENNILLYPNPTSGILTLEIKQNKIIQNILVHNTLGQIVHSSSATGSRSQIDVSGLESGVYYLTIKGAEGTSVRKFIRQ